MSPRRAEAVRSACSRRGRFPHLAASDAERKSRKEDGSPLPPGTWEAEWDEAEPEDEGTEQEGDDDDDEWDNL